VIQEAAQDIRDALDPVPVVAPAEIPWLMIAVGAVAAAFIVYASLWIARRRGTRAPAASPEQAALRRLAELEITNVKPFYFALTDILVEYLGAHFPIGLEFCTSAEILSRLRSIEMTTPESEAALIAFLDVCDRAKFAPSLDSADPADAMRRCRRTIDLFAGHIASMRRLATPSDAEPPKPREGAIA
jgi:hypothetical protein